MSHIALLRRRGFAAFFATQFLGAFNDNLFKNALVILIAYRSATVWSLPADQLVVLAGAIFILPFLLVSATAGQLADKYEKATLIRWLKAAELGVMGVAVVGLLSGALGLLLVVLFFMGLQSAFFGPLKYSILPQLLPEDDLVGGNALVETGTFLAILIGTIVGGVLVALGGVGLWWVSVGVIVVGTLGLLASWLIPRTPKADPGLRIAANPITPALQAYRLTRRNRAVFLSVLGVAWFWFFGASLLALLPSYTKDVLHGNEHVVTLFLAIFCLGISVGALLCERLSEHKLELGLVPFGSIGMTLFALDLFLVGGSRSGVAEPAALAGIGEFVRGPGGVRVIFALVMLAIFSGFFIVPLNTLVQQRSDASCRSRIIAGGNILSALAVVLSSMLLVGLLTLGLSLPQLFLVLALLNAVVASYIYHVIPEFLFRFLAWIIANLMYRLRTVARENIPLEGPVLLVSNHVSFIDWLIIASACKRPVRFVMYHGFLKLPLLGLFFRDAKVIPIAPARESAATLEAAYERIAGELEAGEVVCIFPEGEVTRDGKLGPFRPGVEKIVRRTPVPVVPMALKGLWGSFFSRKYGRAMRRPFRRIWSRVSLVIGTPIAPEDVTAPGLAERVAALGGFDPPAAPPPAAGGQPVTLSSLSRL